MFTPFAFLVPVSTMAVAALQPKILVGGNFVGYKGYYTTDSRFIKIDSTGSVERSTFKMGAGFNSLVEEAAISSSGQIYVGGAFTSYSGSTVNKIVRLNANGTLDTTFNIGTGPNFLSIYAIGVQSDGKVVLAGGFSSFNGTTATRHIRLNTDGSVDTTYATGAGMNSINNVVLKDINSDKMYVAGNATTYSGSTINSIVRINTNGSIDTAFKMGTGFNGQVNYIHQQTDGKLIILGGFTTYSGSTATRICRLNTNGTLDTTYKATANLDTLWADVQPDGKIIIAGNFSSFSGSLLTRLVRTNTDGTIDSTFSIGTGLNSTPQTITSLPGNINVVTGFFTAYNGTTVNRIVALGPSGSIDTTYNTIAQPEFNGTGNGFDNYPACAIRSGSFIFFGGDFTAYKRLTLSRILQLDQSGSIDASFNMGAGANSTVYTAVTQSDGKIIIAGGMTNYSGSSQNRIFRLNRNGTNDTSFSVGTGFGSIVYDVQLQSDGKIIAVGEFTTYNATTRNYITRLNTNGTLDTSFVVGTGFNTSGVRQTAIQTDQKIVAVGDTFTSYSGSSSSRIARINTDGTYDTTYNVGTGFNAGAICIAQQSDGKMIVGGSFTAYSGSSTNTTRIIRLNTNGTQDTSFVTGTGFNSSPAAIKIESNGKILIVGPFTTYSGSSYNRIVRLNSNGTIDTTFSIGTGFNNMTTVTANSLVIDPSGSIYLANSFATYNGTTSNNLIKLGPSGSVDSVFVTSDGTGTTTAGANGLDAFGASVLLLDV